MNTHDSAEKQNREENSSMPQQKAWVVIQKRESKYADQEGEFYEYPLGIPNSRNLKSGDLLVLIRTKDEQDAQGGRIFGLGRIGEIERKSEQDAQGRTLHRAKYDHYLSLDPMISFETVGGDPRNAATNAIVTLTPQSTARILKAASAGAVEDWPKVTHETESSTTSMEPDSIREEVRNAVANELLGPALGPEEEFDGTRPTARYLVGKLAPRRSADPRDHAEEAAASADDAGGDAATTEEGGDDSAAPSGENLTPSSMGMTFAVDAEVSHLELTVSWGRYERVSVEETSETDRDSADESALEAHESESASELDDISGSPTETSRVWRREPIQGVLSIDLASVEERLVPVPEYEEVMLYLKIRPLGSQKVVSVFLVNQQAEPDSLRDQAWVFQPEISVKDPENKPVFRRRRPADEFQDQEQKMLEMLYRNHVEFAVGHGVSVDWDEDPSNPQQATAIRTSFLPEYEVPATDATSPDDYQELAGVELGMRELAELPDDQLFEKLEILPTAYQHWVQQQQSRIGKDDLVGFDGEAQKNLDGCTEAKARIQAGIDSLRSNPQALEAFRFTNLAMALQRTRGIYARKKRQGEDVQFDEVDDNPLNRRWRPFQLGFLLLSLPSLADPEHEERSGAPRENLADLIWFPTGGGKTEAYLGLTAFALAVRRLQGNLGGYDHSAGVTVLMRYTLRLLTLQQFQRATALMCAMEDLRLSELKNQSDRWGQQPFRIGLWVGKKVTPNSTKDSHEEISSRRKGGHYSGGSGDPIQLKSCPWCGSQIDPKKHAEVDLSGKRRTYLYCSDHKCRFSKKRLPAEGLPVVVVDEEIYRLVPSLVIATVDKFAQLPWQGELSALFGRISGQCSRHGYLTPTRENLDSERGGCKGTHPATRGLPATTRQAADHLRPPDLIIQDELHLISGPLGTLVGQYETGLDQLCSWSYNGKTIRPKLVASTATVRMAPQQVWNLFCREVKIFPPPGLDVGNDFFSIRRPTMSSDSPDRKPGRRYMGVCAPGSSRIRILIQAYVAALTAGQHMFEEVGDAADPWMTVVGYFNSIRELGGMVRHLEDDVRSQCRNLANSGYPRPGLAARRRLSHEELTSRLSSTDIPRILDQMEIPHRKSAPSDSKFPLDAVLATNMISVGVDVDRLGLMIVNGQPKTTAEYIQSSSRVGRNASGPGLVLTLLNWARPRDASHYETFRHYHATFYSQVEALSVTPFAPRAVDRGLTGMLTGLIRQSGEVYNPNTGASEVNDLHLPEISEVRDVIVDRVFEVTSSDAEKNAIAREYDIRVERWVDEALKPERDFGYQKVGRGKGQLFPWLKSPYEGSWTRQHAPMSLREVEQNVQLLFLEDSDEEESTPPPWENPPDSTGDSNAEGNAS